MSNLTNSHENLVPIDFPYPPCEIRDRYICLLYAAGDAEIGLKAVKEYNERGYRVWYDTTASSDTIWTSETKRAIGGCDKAVLIIGDAEYNSRYYYYCYLYVKLLNIKRIIVFSGGRINDGKFPDRNEYLVWADAEKEDFGRLIQHECLLEDSQAITRDTECDLGVSFAPSYNIYDSFCTVNIRTHEIWDKNGRPGASVNGKELLELYKDTSAKYVLLPQSYAEDYKETGRDNTFLRELMKLQEEKQKKDEEEKRREALEKEMHIGPFKEGYPYMDEFEYIDSLYD